MFADAKLDEDLSESLSEVLRGKGYVVVTVRSQDWGGFKDPKLWPLIQAESIFFITADKGFGDLRKFSPGSHAGILLLRPDRESIVDYRTLLEQVLNTTALRLLLR
jgi:predicted nuclease of predicted toxin-antitoxin system